MKTTPLQWFLQVTLPLLISFAIVFRVRKKRFDEMDRRFDEMNKRFDENSRVSDPPD